MILYHLILCRITSKRIHGTKRETTVRYKLLDSPGDFHVGTAGLAGVRDEIDDIQDKVGIS